MKACADSSFLFSLYVPDANSATAGARIKRIKLPLLFTDLGELEITNGVALRVFRKELQPFEATAAIIL
ncbi:MAG: hypothetical protein ACRD51_06560, partial [Candidatus Acidiferrum sp.]